LFALCAAGSDYNSFVSDLDTIQKAADLHSNRKWVIGGYLSGWQGNGGLAAILPDRGGGCFCDVTTFTTSTYASVALWRSIWHDICTH